MNSKHAKTKTPTAFRTVLLRIVIINAVLIIAALLILWRYLAVYESHNPIAALRGFLKDVERGDMTAVSQTLELPAPNTIADLSAYLQKIYPKGQYRFAKLENVGEGVRYAIYDGNTKRGTAILSADKKDEKAYVVQPEIQYEGAYTVIAPAFTTVYLNGEKLADTYRVGDVRAVEAFSALHDKARIPQLAEYRVENLLNVPNFTATTADGMPCTVRADQKDPHKLTVLALVNEQDKPAFFAQTETVAKLYAEYISQDAERAALLQHVYRNTDFYAAVCAYDAKWYNKHISHAFENFTITDIQYFSADTYTADVAFDYIVKRTYDSHTYPTKYHMAFQKIGDTYKLVNLQVR